MQPKGRVLKLHYVNKVYLFVKENGVLLTAALFLIAGLFVGIFTYSKNTFAFDYSKNCINDILSKQSNLSFFKIFFDSFAGGLLYAVILFSFGASVLGLALSPFLLAFKGFLYGSVITYLYTEYAFNGIIFNTVFILPSAIFYIIALILFARESVYFSFFLGRLTLPSTAPQSLYTPFKNYCKRCLLICILIVFSSFIDSLISVNFLNKFTL